MHPDHLAAQVHAHQASLRGAADRRRLAGRRPARWQPGAARRHLGLALVRLGLRVAGARPANRPAHRAVPGLL